MDPKTRHTLRNIAQDWCLFRGEPPLRDYEYMREKNNELLARAMTIYDQTERLIAMYEMMVDQYDDDCDLSNEAWDNLVRGFPTEDLDVVRTAFPEQDWPGGIPYPNLVASVGYMDDEIGLRCSRALNAIISETFDRANRVCDMVRPLFRTLVNTITIYTNEYVFGAYHFDEEPLDGTQPYSLATFTTCDAPEWDFLVADFDETTMQIVRDVFPRNKWPPDRYGVPYLNLVAWAKWNFMMANGYYLRDFLAELGFTSFYPTRIKN